MMTALNNLDVIYTRPLTPVSFQQENTFLTNYDIIVASKVTFIDKHHLFATHNDTFFKKTISYQNPSLLSKLFGPPVVSR